MRFISLFLFLIVCCDNAAWALARAIDVGMRPTIVIDAGHGGIDPGTKAQKPFCEEKRICLQSARLVKKYLDQLGYHVVLTRNTDTFVPLSRRVEIARQADAALFVSVHFNSSRNS